MTQAKIKLRIDPEFKQLIPPLSQEEYETLESNIIKDGCREPISVWNGVILDGHNRYAICQKHGIRFSVVCIEVASRQDAVAWICANQLGRRNISEETRKYLIGKRYEAEKLRNSENLLLRNDSPMRKFYAQDKSENERQHTAVALGKEYHLSFSTIQKYGRYAKALDTLSDRGREIVPKILSGQVKVSRDRVIELSQLPEKVSKVMCQRICNASEDMLPYLKSRNILSNTASEKRKTVKDMPEYDPDAEVSILTLTIPSWRGIMGRARTSLGINPVSPQAKLKLRNELDSLSLSLSELMNATSEV